MNLTLAVDEEVVREARRHAEAMGTSVNPLVREDLADGAVIAGVTVRNPFAGI